MLAYAGRIPRIPSLDTIEATMKLSPHVVQALNEGKSTLLQLPHITDDMMRYLFIYFTYFFILLLSKEIMLKTVFKLIFS